MSQGFLIKGEGSAWKAISRENDRQKRRAVLSCWDSEVGGSQNALDTAFGGSGGGYRKLCVSERMTLKKGLTYETERRKGSDL